MLLRKEFLNYCLPIPEGAYYHDTWFAVLSCFMGGFEYTPRLLHKYRLHENQVTHSHRVKRLRWKEFKRNVVHQCTYDRICLLNETEKRIPQMNDDDKSFLYEMRHHVMLDYTKMGRIKNLYFRLKYFRTIYSCKRLF